MADERIYLSPPHLDGDERELLLDALDSNWVAPLGPHVDAFERELAVRAGVAHAAALSSGTAALHLALRIAGVGPDDTVATSSLTFVATANAITYQGAQPVFIDATSDTWQLDPDLLAQYLADASRTGDLPKALVTVDLYGQCCDYDLIVPLCEEYGVTLIEDAAEALGASYRGTPAGAFGIAAAFSFNGNKIITSSGGGMLVSDDGDLITRTRHLATQARDPAAHYEHSEVGFNYRMSNLVAAVGRGQLARLDAKIERRTQINQNYREAFADLEGLGFMPFADYGTPNAWLTCITIAPASPTDRDGVLAALGERNIEGRPVWKPMHLQPLFADAPAVGGSVAEDLFQTGVCLPSGSGMTDAEQDKVIAVLRECWNRT